MYNRVNYSPRAISLATKENRLPLIVDAASWSATRPPCKAAIAAPIIVAVTWYAHQTFSTSCRLLGLPILTSNPYCSCH
ncbi:hypothetical protein ACLOJK_034920, partial [Asimina triloba]